MDSHQIYSTEFNKIDLLLMGILWLHEVLKNWKSSGGFFKLLDNSIIYDTFWFKSDFNRVYNYIENAFEIMGFEFPLPK